MNILGSSLIIIILFSFSLTIFRDIGLSMIFDFDAFLIVIGGTAIALLVGFPLERIKITFAQIISAYRKNHSRDAVVSHILAIARMYMRSNIRDLERKIASVDDDFLKMGLRLLINNYSGRDIKHIMEREMMERLIRSRFSQNLLRTVARLTPSFGLAGTVISLIKMFKHLESVEAIAPMMSVALMSTFYGVIIANLLMLPLCAKLKEHAIESEAVMIITIEGLLAVSNREHPLKIEERIGKCLEKETFRAEDAVSAIAARKVPA